MRECVIDEDGQEVDCKGETVEVRDCNAKPCTGILHDITRYLILFSVLNACAEVYRYMCRLW